MYLMNYATVEDFNAYTDDHGNCKSGMDLAEPQGTLHRSLAGAIDSALRHLEEEAVEAGEYLSLVLRQHKRTRAVDGRFYYEAMNGEEVYGYFVVYEIKYEK